MSNNPIEILGKTFASEAEAQTWYKDDLRKRLPELKKLEGFPIGDDEDILHPSNSPFYTVCPNPTSTIDDFCSTGMTGIAPNQQL